MQCNNETFGYKMPVIGQIFLLLELKQGCFTDFVSTKSLIY